MHFYGIVFSFFENHKENQISYVTHRERGRLTETVRPHLIVLDVQVEIKKIESHKGFTDQQITRISLLPHKTEIEN